MKLVLRVDPQPKFDHVDSRYHCWGDGDWCGWHECAPSAPCLDRTCPHCKGFAFP